MQALSANVPFCEYLPDVHCTHTLSFVAPSVAEYVSSGHSTHVKTKSNKEVGAEYLPAADREVGAEYLPAAQIVQLEARSVEENPMEQREHTVACDGEEYVPGLQFWQNVAPTTSPYVPAGQLMH